MQKGKHIHQADTKFSLGDANKRVLYKSKKIPLQGEFVIALTCVLFLLWLGFIVFVAKLVIG